MPGCEEKKRGGEQPAAAISTLITSFKPRQVLLSSTSKPNMKQQLEKEKKSTITLNREQRVLFYHSICQFLELNGFLKTLKKFRHETHVEKDSWKSCSLNLEEICQEHLQKRSNANAKVLYVKQKEDSANHDVSLETVEGTKENGADDGKKFNTMLENNPVNGDYVKSKKKKKNTKANDSSNHLNGETNLNEADHPVEDIPSLPSEPVKKSKDKKKQKHESEPLDKELLEKQAEVAAGKPSEKEDVVSQEVKSKSKKRKEETSIQKDEADKEKKDSKKRKKSSSNDSDTGHVEETSFDDSKRRRNDNSDQSNGTEQAPKTPKGSANGVLGNNGGKKSEKKNKTKEHDDSAQPNTANAFQRVKADEVKFADERLQDNSYWAKDGADSGYGAKAQEVLGQVRGRDFRHEKTKKKRGSYRGGQIDLQSHSVKFNYDDDDE